jgi:tetratricopeptide (TPR) repeat protein
MLKSVEGIVTDFIIADTGSTDDTPSKIERWLETHSGQLYKDEWKNFGHNRTLSFEHAQEYCRAKNYNLDECYGLLLDCNMVFHAGNLLETPLTLDGYSLTQKLYELDYNNCRLIKLSKPWKCVGRVHEYWTFAPTPRLNTTAHIVNIHDGGYDRANKYHRYLQFLLEDLEENPNNPRTLFYLGQTYNILGNHTKSIEFYKKHIRQGSWDEEEWFSHFAIGQNYHTLRKFAHFEKWMLLAFAKRPTRAEPIYELAKHFRIAGQHYKAYHYATLGKAIPKPNDSLFVSHMVYDGLFDYELSICEYYVHNNQPELGIRASEECIRRNINVESVKSNLQFYTNIVNLFKSGFSGNVPDSR